MTLRNRQKFLIEFFVTTNTTHRNHVTQNWQIVSMYGTILTTGHFVWYAIAFCVQMVLMLFSTSKPGLFSQP